MRLKILIAYNTVQGCINHYKTVAIQFEICVTNLKSLAAKFAVIVEPHGEFIVKHPSLTILDR